MENQIVYKQISVSTPYGNTSLTDYTRHIPYIPAEFYANEKFVVLKVDDDMAIDLVSYAYYRDESYWDVLMAYNKMYSPLEMPKNYRLLEEITDRETTDWLDRNLYKSKNQESIPDIKLKNGVWYLYEKNKAKATAQAASNAEIIDKLNYLVEEEAKHLGKLEEEYEDIKSLTDGYGSYRRKILRSKIDESRKKIFNWQDDILVLQNTGDDVKGIWVPTTRENIESFLGRNLLNEFYKIREGILNKLDKENEKYRYMKFPTVEVMNDIIEHLNSNILLQE